MAQEELSLAVLQLLLDHLRDTMDEHTGLFWISLPEVPQEAALSCLQHRTVDVAHEKVQNLLDLGNPSSVNEF